MVFTQNAGYAIEMATRPQTLYGLVDSPVALAAWLIDHGDGDDQPAATVRGNAHADRGTTRGATDTGRCARQHHPLLADQDRDLYGPQLARGQSSAGFIFERSTRVDESYGSSRSGSAELGGVATTGGVPTSKSNGRSRGGTKSLGNQTNERRMIRATSGMSSMRVR